MSSWFYLTLWRGTPQEFTTEFTANVNNIKFALADICSEDFINAKVTTMNMAEQSIKIESTFDAEISTTNSTTTSISCIEGIEANIVKDTEVVWNVG